MRKSLVLAASAIALAGCEGGGSVTVEDPTDPEQIAAALENLPKPQAGEYRIGGELLEFDAEGATEEEAQFARGMFEMMFAQERTLCMTQEEAERVYQDSVENLNNGSEECEYSSYTVDGNTVAATMQCDDGAGSAGTIDFNGTITETSQDLTISTDMSNDGQAVRMSLNLNLERTGDCAADAGNG